MLLLVGLMMFSTGLIGELVMRTYFESQNKRPYRVQAVHNLSFQEQRSTVYVRH